MSALARHVPELDGRTWRALVLLTTSLVQRLLRDGMVLRSMIWPSGITVGTLLLVLATFAVLGERVEVAVDETVPPALIERLEAHGWTVLRGDAEALVREGRAFAGTDGRVLWTRSEGIRQLELEAVLREHAGAPWRPSARDALPRHGDDVAMADLLCRILAVLFALYGAVFGLGSVARDRDDGSLLAELTLPVPHWVPGLARWAAATAVITAFYAFAVATFHAILGVSDPWPFVRHGFAAAGGAAAIGLMVVGGAGLERGFSGPLATTMALVTGAMGAGLVLPDFGQALPIASVLAGGTGWAPAGAALVLGVLAAAVFSVRSART